MEEERSDSSLTARLARNAKEGVYMTGRGPPLMMWQTSLSSSGLAARGHSDVIGRTHWLTALTTLGCIGSFLGAYPKEKWEQGSLTTVGDRWPPSYCTAFRQRMPRHTSNLLGRQRLK